MRNLLPVLLLAATMTFTGCIDILEEMFLKSDGSGKYAITIDMSSVMDESVRSLLEDMEEEEGETEEAKVEDEPIETDTIIYMKDMPAKKRGNISRPDFYDKISMKIEASESREVLKISYMLDFDNMDDVHYFLENMDKLVDSDEEENPLASMGIQGAGGGTGGLLPSISGKEKLFEWSKKTFKRFTAPQSVENPFESDEMEMARMMFSGATYRTVYHFPGKVKKVDHPNAVINGKTVTIENDVMDVIEGKANLATTIKFKNR